MSYPISDHAWEASKSYLVGDVVRASASQGLTLAFKCIVAGTSDDTEPVFPRQITHTVVDDEVTWEAFEPLSDELQKLAPTAVIDLFQIHLTSAVNGSDSVLYYHAGTNNLVENVVFDGKTYPAAPVEVDGFAFSSKGTLPRPTLKVANVNNGISALLLTVNPLKAEVRRIRTFKKFLDVANFGPQLIITEDEDILITQAGDSLASSTEGNATADPDAKSVETWYIDRVASENLQFVEFELTSRLDLINLQLPRRVVNEFCPWKYRGTECGYNGSNFFDVHDDPTFEANDVCGKRLSSCRARFPDDKGDGAEAIPFGGFVGARLQA
jgi:phage-related protein